MPVVTKFISLETEGNGDILDLTAEISKCIADTDLMDGIATIFSPSATSGITTLEFEPGCVEDLKRLFDEIAAPNRIYAHNQLQGDGNGHSHVRAAIVKASFTVPIVDGKMTLGTWQSIILVDFDNRPRHRKLVVQVIGE